MYVRESPIVHTNSCFVVAQINSVTSPNDDGSYTCTLSAQGHDVNYVSERTRY